MILAHFNFAHLNTAQWVFIGMIIALIALEIGMSYYFDKKDNQ